VPAFTFATGLADAFFAAAMIFSPFSSLYGIALLYDVSVMCICVPATRSAELCCTGPAELFCDAVQVPFIRTALNIHQRLCNCKCKFIHFETCITRKTIEI
jgi:hypothetical protein